MGTTLYQVDAFAAEPFSGNPAGVCILPAFWPDSELQALAQEMNLSETAFVVEGDNGWKLRWFTPAVEVDLCGHATLATAHILYETGRLPPDAVARFATRSGELTVKKNGHTLEMNFPARVATKCDPPQGLASALGVTPIWVGRSVDDVLVQIEHEADVRRLKPDISRLTEVEARGVIVTARGEAPFDFVSRFFAPRAGVNEDPVTGSAHCTLAPHWASILDKTRLQAYQASPRGGVVGLEVKGPRVILSGQAITIFEATLRHK